MYFHLDVWDKENDLRGSSPENDQEAEGHTLILTQ